SEQAAFVWLDVLENLPPKGVCVFTTNDLKKLPQRLRDRCEVVHFRGSELDQSVAVQELIAKVWKEELGRDDWPYPEQIGLAADKDGNVSFRRVLQTLAPIIRNGGALPAIALVQRPAAHPDAAAEDEDDGSLLPPSIVAWLLGGALVVLVGALAILACVTE